MLTKSKKQRIIKGVQTHQNDTGSPEAQVALITERIDELAKHLKKHQKDNHSRRGLLQLVADRQSHLKYLQKKDINRYNALVEKLDIRRKSPNTKAETPTKVVKSKAKSKSAKKSK